MTTFSSSVIVQLSSDVFVRCLLLPLFGQAGTIMEVYRLLEQNSKSLKNVKEPYLIMIRDNSLQFVMIG